MKNKRKIIEVTVFFLKPVKAAIFKEQHENPTMNFTVKSNPWCLHETKQQDLQHNQHLF